MYAYAVISPSRLARCTARPSGCCRGARPPPAHLSRNTAAQQGQRQRPPALQRCQELRASSGREGSEAGGEEAEELPLGDWRAFRAKLVSTQQQQLQGGGGWSARSSEDNLRLLELQAPGLAAEGVWAHATPLRPERGGLLLATPKTAAAMGGEEYCECVVLLVQHSAGGGGGSMGLILNRPTGMVLGRRRGGLPFEVSGAPPNMQAVFSDNRVYCGGFVAQQVLHVLHGHALPRAVEVVPGVFVGGEAAAVDAATAGQLDPSGFKFYSGAVVWEAGDLEAQVKAGVWLTAAASRSLILKPCLQLPTPLWTEVLMLMGGEAAQMAKDAWEGDE